MPVTCLERNTMKNLKMQISTLVGSAPVAVLGVVLAGLVNGLSQPIITKQPTDQSVSLGASARFQVTATSTNPPIRYLWQFGFTNLTTQTNASLSLTNV